MAADDERHEDDEEMEDLAAGEGENEDDEESDQDSDDEEDGGGGEGNIGELGAAVDREPYVYDHHVKYIAAARRKGLLEEVRGARERMNSLFPLSPQLWLQWVEDEQRLAISSEDQQGVRALFQRGVKEYMSVLLWRSYTNFMVKCWTDAGCPISAQSGSAASGAVTEADVQSGCEEALTHVGLHPSAGHSIWAAYRDFKAQLLRQMLSPGVATSEKMRSAQVQGIRSLFTRQLAVPHTCAARTAAEYIAWEGALAGKEGKEAEEAAAEAVGAAMAETTADVSGSDVASGLPQGVQGAFVRAAAAMEKRRGVEERLSELQGESEVAQVEAQAEASLAQAYHDYWRMEEADGNDPARVQLAFERAVTALPVDISLWNAYTAYVDKNLSKVPRVVCAVHARAVRNCPWVGSLWVTHLLALERSGADETALSQAFEQALLAGIQDPKEYLEVFLTRVDGLRRRLQAEKDKASPGAAQPKAASDGPAPDQKNATLESQAVDTLRSTFDRIRAWVETTEASAAEASGAQASVDPSAASSHWLDPDFRIPSYWSAVEADVVHDVQAARAVWDHALQRRAAEVELWQRVVAFEVQRGDISKARALFRRAYSRRFSADWGAQVICSEWLRFEREHGTLADYDSALAKVSDRLAQLAAIEAQVQQQQQEVPVGGGGGADGREGKRQMRRKGGEQAEVAEGQQGAGGRKRGRAEEEVGKQAVKRGRGAPTSAPTSAAPVARGGQAGAAAGGAKSGAPGEGRRLGTEAQDRASDGNPARQGAEAGHEEGDAAREQQQQQRFTDERTVFVSGLPLQLREEELKGVFQQVGITPRAVRLVFDRQTKRFRGFAYVELQEEGDVAAAEQRLNKHHMNGRRISVKKSDPSRGRGHDGGAEQGEGQCRGVQGHGRGMTGQGMRGRGRRGEGDFSRGSHAGGHPGGQHPSASQHPVGHRRGGHLQLFGTPTFAMPRRLSMAATQQQSQMKQDGAPATGDTGAGGDAAKEEKPVASNADFRALFKAKLVGPEDIGT